MRCEEIQDFTVLLPGAADEAAPSIGAHPAPIEWPYGPAHGAVVTTGKPAVTCSALLAHEWLLVSLRSPFG